MVCNFCFSNSAYNKANIFLGLIEYELNSLLGASHLVDYISVHIRFDLERYLLNILLFREPPSFVFQLNTFIHLNSCKHCRLRCYYLEFVTKRICLYFQPIRLQLRRYCSGYLWNRKLCRMPIDPIQAHTSTTSTEIESS